MQSKYRIAWAIAALLAIPASQALAENVKPWSLSAGGGVVGFTDNQANDITDPGGTWEVRGAYNLMRYVGIEGAYVGSSMGLDAIGLDEDAYLIGTKLEADIVLDYPIRVGEGVHLSPYGLAGIGWSNYNISNADFNTSNVDDNTNAAHFPLGAGLNLGFTSWLIDLRTTYRPSTGNLTDINRENSSATPHTWDLRANVGVRF